MNLIAHGLRSVEAVNPNHHRYAGHQEAPVQSSLSEKKEQVIESVMDDLECIGHNLDAQVVSDFMNDQSKENINALLEQFVRHGLNSSGSEELTVNAMRAFK